MRVLQFIGLAAMTLASIGPSALSRPASKRAELDGVWILLRSQVGPVRLTPAGEKLRAAYDFQKDDPDFECKPASFTRIMHTPSPPIEIRQHKNEVEINYEFMDVRRRIPLKPGLSVKDAPYTVQRYPHLGRSVGRYEEETLVIETAGQQAGVLDTLGAPGLYQSNEMATVERFSAEGNMMQIIVTHVDPVIFVQPLTVTYSYLRLPGGKIEKWGCKPEEATYKKFIPPKQ